MFHFCCCFFCYSANRLTAVSGPEFVSCQGHFLKGDEAVFGFAPGTGLSALRGGAADTMPTGLGPTAGGIMTSSPPEEGLDGAARAGLRGRGLWGGDGEWWGCSWDTNIGERVGLRGSGFLGGLSLWAWAWA